MVERGVNEYTRVVPSTGFDTDCLMNQSMLREVLVGDSDRYKKHEKDAMTNKEHSLCLLSRATRDPSALHTTYLTGGVVISAMVFCCWIS